MGRAFRGQKESKGEVIHTAASGGQKGRKPETYSLIPPNALEQVARVYGYGARKYDDHNWAKGYPYSWSLDALHRHVKEFEKGISIDPESGVHHLAHAAFHLFTLMEFERARIGSDDRLCRILPDAPPEV